MKMSTCGGQDELYERPAKRVRTLCDADAPEASNGHSYGNTTIYTSDMVVMGNHIQQARREPRYSSMVEDEDNYNILLKSLLFDRIDFRVNNVKKALLSTCEWLFRHPHFQTWYQGSPSNEHSGFLWIKGKPGCGKSTLMKAALEWSRKRKPKDRVRQTIVPYFFNARASASLEKSSLGLYRTVVHHLLSSHPSLRKPFMTRFALKHPGQSGENWTAEELQGFLEDVIDSNEPVGLYLFIDALDEAEFEDDVRQMISFLIQLSDRALALGAFCNLQICLSSRHYPHISIGRGLSFVVEDQPEHGQDIEIYITKQLTCLNGPEKDDLRANIVNKSARIFLWVVLVVEMLNKLDDHGAPLSDMKARLETIPAGLNELFKEILMKSDYGIETSVLFFQWMIFRMRPLEPAELFVAIEYSRSSADPRWSPPTKVSLPSPDRLARYIVSCSRGLAEIVESKPPVVQFIHETVREFLQKENGLASIVPALAMNLAGISHEILRIACLRCISAIQMPQEYKPYCEASHKTNVSLETFKSDMRWKLPFLDYAIMHLFDHAEQAQKHGVSQKTFLKNQMNHDGLWLDGYRLWWNVLERYKTKKIKSNSLLLDFIAEKQYSGLLPVLINLSITASATHEAIRTLLVFASRGGCAKEVEVLLDMRADVNGEGSYYVPALQAASANGHDTIVQILIEAGADINAESDSGDTALIMASETGHDKVVQVLIDAGVNIDAQGRSKNSALRMASIQGHEKIVKMLINAGGNVNLKGEHYTVIQEVVLSGHEKITQILIDGGANVDSSAGNDSSLLEMASSRGRQKVVQVLTNAISYDQESYNEALRSASGNGHEQVVRTLIDLGADVNAQGGHYGNALQAASAHGYEKIVQILIEAGADINAQGGVYGNTLQTAAACGKEGVVQILIGAGADVNAQGGFYGNVLQTAAACGKEGVVQILIGAGADVNAQGGLYGNTLKAASSNGYEKIVQILMEAGADVSVRGGNEAPRKV